MRSVEQQVTKVGRFKPPPPPSSDFACRAGTGFVASGDEDLRARVVWVGGAVVLYVLVRVLVYVCVRVWWLWRWCGGGGGAVSSRLVAHFVKYISSY